MTILIYTAVLLTIFSALGLGILTGYAIIMGLLHAFGYSTRQAQSRAAVAPLQPAIAQSSGD
jgi:hypothetical protein